MNKNAVVLTIGTALVTNQVTEAHHATVGLETLLVTPSVLQMFYALPRHGGESEQPSEQLRTPWAVAAVSTSAVSTLQSTAPLFPRTPAT
jgi:hypothetical protein